MDRFRKLVRHIHIDQDIKPLNASSISSETKRIIHLGPISKELYTDIGELPNLHSLPSYNSMREQFWSNGYGLFRNAISRESVLKARNTILSKLQNEHNIFADIENGILKSHIQQSDLPFIEGRNALTQNMAIHNVLESDSINKIMKMLFNCDSVKTFDYKWLRLVAPGQNTGVHVDNVYMSRGTKQLLTCWIPLMNISMDLGTIFVLDGSYSMPSFNVFQQTYGSMDAERINLNGTGHFTQNPDEMKQFYKDETDYKLRWKSCDFKAGDVLIFTMRTVHMSSVNNSKKNQLRINCDTRWLNANHIADDRFMYDANRKSMGHEAKFGINNTDSQSESNVNQVSMQQLRQKWGI